MKKTATKPAVEKPTVKQPTRDEILIKQAELFKLRERYQQGIAQCNAQINELEGMIKPERV